MTLKNNKKNNPISELLTKFQNISFISLYNQRLGKDGISVYSANSTFFLFLSIVPLLIVICAVLPFTLGSQADLIEAIQILMPDSLDDFFVSLISSIYNIKAGVISLSVITALWSSSKAMVALRRGFNTVLGIKESNNAFIVRCLASAFTALLLLSMIMLFVLEVLYDYILSLLENYLPVIAGFVSTIFGQRHLIAIVLTTLVIAILYTFVPCRKRGSADNPRFLAQLPGAFIASLAWSLCSYGFSIYLSYADFSIYGSLSVVIILLLWLYLCINILLFALLINSYIQQRKQ